MHTDFLSHAVDIGHAIVDACVEDQPTGVYWRSHCPFVPDSAQSVSWTNADAGVADLYLGNAGIALFLAHLYAASGDARFKHCAEHGMRWAIERPRTADEGHGFFSGRTGVAYASIHVGSLIANASLVHDGWRLLQEIEIGSRDGPDVISGIAGMLIALAALVGRAPDLEWCRSRLVAGAEVLRDTATRDRVGWCWRVAPFPSPLTGYAHGAAGIGHALLEVWRVTGAPWTRYLAEQAFAYEQHFVRCKDGAMDWPDLRRGPLVPPMPPGTSTCAKVWCYGSAGIGMSRLRAFDIIGDERYRDQALAAWRSAAAATVRGLDLCHGGGGIVDFDLDLYRSLGDERFLEHAVTTVERRIHDPHTSADDPSLMVGLAGIGFTLLRTTSLGAVPSVLCLSPTEAPRPALEQDEAITALRWDHIASVFPSTVRMVDRVELPPIAAVEAGTDELWFSTTAKQHLVTPAALDGLRYESRLWEQWVAGGQKPDLAVTPYHPPWGSFDWTTLEFARGHDICVDAFDRGAFVFFTYHETARCMRVNPMIAAMLGQLDVPRLGREWVNGVASALSISDGALARFQRAFAQQLEALYDATIVVLGGPVR